MVMLFVGSSISIFLKFTIFATTSVFFVGVEYVQVMRQIDGMQQTHVLRSRKAGEKAAHETLKFQRLHGPEILKFKILITDAQS